MKIFKKHKNGPIEPNQTNEFSFRIKISNNNDSKEEILWRFMATHHFQELEDIIISQIGTVHLNLLHLLDEYKKKLYVFDSQIQSYELKKKNSSESEENKAKIQDEINKIQLERSILKSKITETEKILKNGFNYKTIRELSEYPDLVKIIVNNHFNFFAQKYKMYIDSCLVKYYKEFLLEQGLTETEFSSPRIMYLRLEDGSLLTLFNLFVTSAINLGRCYDFVYRFVEQLLNTLQNEFSGYNVTLTATPVYHNNPVSVTSATDNNNNNNIYTRPIINHIFTVLILYSIIITIVAIFCFFNPSNSTVKKIVKEETEQMIKYEIPTQVDNAILKEKVNCVFIRDFILPLSANDTVKAKK